MQILANLNMGKNQILNVVLQKLATDPANPVPGLIYYNTTDNRAKIYNGTGWVGMDGIGATMTAQNIVDAINSSILTIDLENLPQSVQDAVAAAHTEHAISDITGLQGALDAKETPAGATAKAATAESNANAYTDGKVAALVESAPGTLDTLNELAAALGDDPNFATTITNMINGKATKFTQAVGDGSATSIVVTHNLNTRDAIVTLREGSSPWAIVYTDVEMTSLNTITLKFAVAPTASQYTVTVVG